jgi:SAM-dependent methyltransferase
MTVECRVCDSTHLELAIDLGEQPWCNNFLKPDQLGKEPYYPLRVVHCARCGTAQLDFTVPKEVMFADHTYLSGTTRSLAVHFQEVADTVDATFFSARKSKCVLDIGSNDGTQLAAYQRLGYEVVGVESSQTAVGLANAAGIPTIHDFFNESVAHSLARQFDIVNAAGVFFHLEELHSVTEGIRQVLAPDGVFVVQCLYMKSIIENLAFDQIYHEHLLYYTIHSLSALLERHNLEIFDAWVSDIHGGSLIALATHAGSRAASARLQTLRAAEESAQTNALSTYRALAARIETMKDVNVSYLYEIKEQGRRAFGLGAPAKGNTLLNYFRIGPALLECLVERNRLRRGLWSPGMHIPIVIEDELEGPPDVYYVLAWNFRNEIMARHSEDIKRGVEFYFPVTPLGAAQ